MQTASATTATTTRKPAQDIGYSPAAPAFGVTSTGDKAPTRGGSYDRSHRKPARIPPIHGIIIGVGVGIASAAEPQGIFGEEALALGIIPAAPDIIELRRAAFPDEALPAQAGLRQ